MGASARLNPFGVPVVGNWQPESSKPPPKLTLEERKVEALERIADALEARNTIDESMAHFAQLLTGDAQEQRTASGTGGEFADLAPDGLPWGNRGAVEIDAR